MKLAWVYVTFPTRKIAHKIVDQLLAERRIACANLFPIEARYHWKRKIEKGTEVAALLKARASTFRALSARINELHPYDVPCVLKIDLDDALPAFARYVAAETR